MASTEDLREHKRLQTRVGVEFRVASTNDESRFMEAITRDISAGGVFIELAGSHLTTQGENEVDDFLLIKSPIELKISLPSHSDNILAKGRAVWIEKQLPGKDYRHGVAITFTEIASDDRKLIDRYVLSRL
jgi:c-di-GMP-binding flagellar brake protein YcgR